MIAKQLSKGDARIVGICCGLEDCDDHDVHRHEPLLKMYCGKTPAAEVEQSSFQPQRLDHGLGGRDLVAFAVHLKMAQDQGVIDSKGAQHMSRLAIVERIKTMSQRLTVNRHDRHRVDVDVRLRIIQQGGMGAKSPLHIRPVKPLQNEAHGAAGRRAVPATRMLLRRAAQSGGGVRGWVILLVELFLDLLAAAIFLTALAILLPMLFEMWNRLGVFVHINWTQMADNAYRDSLGAGVLVAGMLATTFLPTLMHLSYGLLWLPPGMQEVFDCQGG